MTQGARRRPRRGRREARVHVDKYAAQAAAAQDATVQFPERSRKQNSPSAAPSSPSDVAIEQEGDS